MRRRFGSFLFIVGMVILLVFFASDQSQNPQFGLFFSGLVLVVLGLYFALRFRKPPEPSQRFRLLRKLSGRNKKDQPS